MTQKYKKTGNIGLFDIQFTQEKLSAIGNPLEMISKVIDFEVFREKLESKLLNNKKKNNAGARPFDVIIMRFAARFNHDSTTLLWLRGHTN